MRRSASLSLVAGIAFAAGFVIYPLASAAVKGSAMFRDVAPGAFYDDAVGEMASLGIIKGYDDGRFGPNDYVTRGQVAVLMKRLRDDIKGITPSTGGTQSSSRSSSSSSRSSASSSSSVAQTTPGAGTLHFSTDSVEIIESVPNISLSIMRTNGSDGVVTVTYAMTGVTALGGSDFTASNGTVTFQAGETSKIITVNLINDKAGEAEEFFKVSLKSVTGGAGISAPSEVTVGILDNDGGTTTSGGGSSSSTASVNTAGGISFSAKEYGFAENEGTATITVVRTKDLGTAASVNYATSNGTANSTYYTAANGTLNFSAGESSKTFTVGIIDNDSIGGNKTVNLTLSAPSNGATLGTSTAVLSIEDNEMSAFATGTGTIQYSASTFAVTEGNDGIVTVARVGGHKGTVNVNYATAGGSAVSGTDYTAVNGTLTFLPGETKKTFIVPTTDDTVPGEQETVNLTLSNVTGGAALGLNTAVLDISE